MSVTSISKMADELGVTACRGINDVGQYCHVEHHLTGTVTDDGVIHFAIRPDTQVNRLAFLRLVARSQDPSLDEDDPWRRVYRMHMAVRALSRQLRIRNPSRPQTSMEKAFVLASVAGLSNDVPLRKQAFDWARRGPKKEET